jgi:hypothetical protein
LVVLTAQAATSIATGNATTTGLVSAKVAALMEGVLKAMFMRKLKTVAAMLLLGAILTGGVTAGVLVYEAHAGDLPVTLPQSAPKNDPTPIAPEPSVQATRQPDPKKADAQSPTKLDVIKQGDLLNIVVADTLPDGPIRGVYQVEKSGKVNLGALYGRVGIQDMTLEDAEREIGVHLKTILIKPAVSITRCIPTADSAKQERELLLERRVQELERDVSKLRAIVDMLRKKSE